MSWASFDSHNSWTWIDHFTHLHSFCGRKSRFNFITSIWTCQKFWELPWHFGKLSFYRNWTWAWEWSWTSSWQFHFTFWFNNNSVIFTRFFSLFRSQHWILYQYTIKLNHQYLMITLHWWGKCLNINSLIWTPFLNQFWLPLLNLDLIWVKFPSQYQFLFLFHLSPNPSSPKITFHCWTRMLKKMTQ